MFEKEIYVWVKLEHDNVLPCLGYAIDSQTGYPLIISEWMNHGSAWSYVHANKDISYSGILKIASIPRAVANLFPFLILLLDAGHRGGSGVYA